MFFVETVLLATGDQCYALYCQFICFGLSILHPVLTGIYLYAYGLRQISGCLASFSALLVTRTTCFLQEKKGFHAGSLQASIL